MKTGHNKLKHLLLYACMLILIMLFVPGLGTEKAYAAAVKASKSKVTLYTASEPYKIKLKNVETGAKISYSSSDKSVITVKKGAVTPVGEGTAAVTAKVTQNSKTSKVKITFTVVKSELKFLEEPPTSVIKGEKLQLRLKGLGISTKKPVWTTSDDSVISLNSKGVIKALKVGTATITATDRTGKYSCSVKIKVTDSTAEKLKKKATFVNKYISGIKCLSDSEEIEQLILKRVGDLCSSFNIFVSDLDLVPSEKHFSDTFTSIFGIEYLSVTQYANGYEIQVKADQELSYYPEEFMIDYTISTGDTKYLTDKTAKDTYNRLVKVADSLKEADEADTVQAIHDYLVTTYEYTKNNTDYDAYHKLSFALSDHECVCDGYTKSFYFLCRYLGIDAKLVHGTGKANGKTELHSWNKVKVNGKWYNMDITWDDPLKASNSKDNSIHYYYYCIPDSILKYDHIWDNTDLPSATDSDLYIPYTRDGYDKIKTLNNGQEFIDYTGSMIDEKAAELVEFINNNPGQSKTVEMKFILKNVTLSDNTAYYNNLAEIIGRYYELYNKKFGYAMNYKSIGPLGILYEVSLKR